jgi:hypothetical protein
VRVLIGVIAVFLITSLGIFFYNSYNKNQPSVNQRYSLATPTPIPSVFPLTDIKASFSIKTGSTVRNFSNPKYHNRSEDVYITSADPSVIYVKKKGVKWSDFFATLPMKLTKECLTTGDGETYCDIKDGSLKFYINGVEDKDALDKEIKEEDKLEVIFIPD